MFQTSTEISLGRTEIISYWWTYSFLGYAGTQLFWYPKIGAVLHRWNTGMENMLYRQVGWG